MWRVVDDEILRSILYLWLEDKQVLVGGEPPKVKVAPFGPNKVKVANLIEALKAVAQLPNITDPPFWIDPMAGDPDPTRLLTFRNGVLNLDSLELAPPDPRLFSINCIDTDYDPAARAPRWERFLDEIFPDDVESQETLEEEMGYTLTSDRSQQKIFCAIGLPRSGKGTIGRLLHRLLGRLYCGPTVEMFGDEQFGLMTLLGKTAAGIADARENDRAGPKIIVGRLLSISGLDTVERRASLKGPGRASCRRRSGGSRTSCPGSWTRAARSSRA